MNKMTKSFLKETQIAWQSYDEITKREESKHVPKIA